jgi:hypothetical protein
MSSRLSDRGLTKLLNTYAARTFLKHPIINPQYTAAEIAAYIDITRSTILWHGTGRYHHAGDGLTDVLRSIMTNGGLQPAYDAYGIFAGGKAMDSISLTTLRIIARSYADMHGRGHKEPDRYGDALTWVSYYYGLFYARLYAFNSFRVRRYWKQWHSLTHDENGDNTWGKKVNKKAQDVWDAFGLGSDIAGNYPILIGVTQLQSQVTLSAVFNQCEVRTLEPILLENMSHLEVPAHKVTVTRKILADHGYNLLVFPIELGETVASRQTFGSLLGLSRS